MEDLTLPHGVYVLPTAPKVAVVGDSVIAGLGVGGRSYARQVAREIGASHVLQLARSTHTIHNAVGHLERLTDYKPDLVIVSVGGSDSLVHAGLIAQRLLDRFAPKSWQGVEGLEPRPWFSNEVRERRRQKVTMAGKLVLKHVGIRLTGGYRRVPPTEFAPVLEKLVAGIVALDCCVVMVGLHQADDRLWPRTNASVNEYTIITLDVARRYPSIVYLDPRPFLAKWDDFAVDHAHFNESGHAKIAEAILSRIAVSQHSATAP